MDRSRPSLDRSRPRQNYFAKRFDDNPFPDPDLVDSADVAPNRDLAEHIDGMLRHAFEIGLP